MNIKLPIADRNESVGPFWMPITYYLLILVSGTFVWYLPAGFFSFFTFNNC